MGPDHQRRNSQYLNTERVWAENHPKNRGFVGILRGQKCLKRGQKCQALGTPGRGQSLPTDFVISLSEMAMGTAALRHIPQSASNRLATGSMLFSVNHKDRRQRFGAVEK